MKKVTKVILVLLLVLVTAGGTFAGTLAWLAHTTVDMSPIEFKARQLTRLIDAYFIDDYDPEVVAMSAADAMAEGMVEGLGDRWSYYISADRMADYLEQSNNAYVGIGVTIKMVEQGAELKEVTKGGPAEEAGLQVGDLVVRAEGQDAVTLGMEGLVDTVRGEEGSFVNLDILRGTERFTVEVERRAILTPVATLEMLEDNIALIKIFNFDTRCAAQTLSCMETALDQGAEAFLFDVRFNPGGMKKELVVVLDYLLPEGEIFRSVDFAGQEEIDTSDANCVDLPMAVLVNQDSYSAAEFFAAALQEYDAAEVVGTRTSGKGNFQYTMELGDGSAVALSSGKYFTPQGKSLTDVGIVPDAEVDLSLEAYQKLYYKQLPQEEDAQMQTALEILREQIS